MATGSEPKAVSRRRDGVDYHARNLRITLLADEEEHRRECRGLLQEYPG